MSSTLTYITYGQIRSFRVLNLLILLCLAFSLASCGGESSETTEEEVVTIDPCDLSTCENPVDEDEPTPKTNKSSFNTNFESGQTHPLRLSPDGSHLFAANTAANSVSVFSLSDPSAPALIAEIPVGIDPVSVWPISNEEVWVVNHVSDSISVVSVSQKLVIDTIASGDEPADIVVAGSPAHAYVSVARSKEVRVFDLSTHTLVKIIPLQGEYPQALTVSPDGEKVYVAFALSGNHTTIVPRTASVMPPLEPAISGLPLAPRTGLIIDASDPEWFPSVLDYTVLDHDIAEIFTSNQSLSRYYDRVGTVNLGLTVNPTNGDLFVTNTEALNLTFFLQNLRGHVVDNRITRVTTDDTSINTPFDLNPGIDYSQLPNNSALSTALAQPTDILFDPSGDFMWLASFGTDRIAKVNIQGEVIARIEVGNAPGSLVDSENKRGPRGLALKAADERLYVQNRLSNTLTTIDTKTLSILNETTIGDDPTPLVIKQGRGFFYDAKLSGNGTASCASCHVDGTTDNLAWNLGDLEGAMVSVTDPISGTIERMHPMKGPMVTQTLAGLKDHAPYHWRGEMPDLLSFNVNFDKIMGGVELNSADMQKLSDFINSITLHPNPNLKLDRTLSDEVLAGDPEAGLNRFQQAGFLGFEQACSSCHSLPSEPFKLQISPAADDVRAAKVPRLTQIYKKQSFDNSDGAITTLGFGETQDGAVANMGGNGLVSFLVSWDTGTAPAVGVTQTIKSNNVNNTSVINTWSTLETRALAGDNGIFVHGQINGAIRRLYYSVTDNTYVDCNDDLTPLSHAELVAEATNGSTFSIMGIHPDSIVCASNIRLQADGWNSDNGFELSATCDGENISPALVITNSNNAIQSWALVMDDPDAPTNDPFVHWLLYNIDKDVSSIPSSLPNTPTIETAQLLTGATQGINSFTNGEQIGYRGPCPPADESHGYEFTLYGLDTDTEIPANLTKNELLETISDDIISTDRLTVFYR